MADHTLLGARVQQGQRRLSNENKRVVRYLRVAIASSPPLAAAEKPSVRVSALEAREPFFQRPARLDADETNGCSAS